MNKDPKILFYDIETTPLKAYVWSCGKQVVRHNQLCKDAKMYNIICITYCWNDGKPAKALTWNYRKQDSSKMIKEFDKIIKEADITIGKNSDRFDVKQINSQRMLHDLSPLPEWVEATDDLEKQIRKFFYLPSYSLDYLSELLGFGGKVSMKFQDWIDIVEQNGKAGRDAMKKMVDYGKKDVEDTRSLWYKLSPHCKPKLNLAYWYGHQDGDFLRCKWCGGSNLVKNGTDKRTAVPRQRFYCKDCNREAGKASTNNKVR